MWNLLNSVCREAPGSCSGGNDLEEHPGWRVLINDLNNVAVLQGVHALNINGRMIFTRLQEPDDQDALSFAHG